MSDRAAILDARHLVASAGGNVACVAAQITRALAWQVGDEAAVASDLETALVNLANAQRQLHEAITAMRIATEVAT